MKYDNTKVLVGKQASTSLMSSMIKAQPPRRLNFKDVFVLVERKKKTSLAEIHKD